MDDAWASLLRQDQHTLSTKLTPDQCRERIAGKLVPPLGWELSRRRLTEEGLVQGSVSATGFKLWKFTMGNNSFKPVALGEYVELSRGTRVVVRIAIQEFVSTFLGCYFTGVVLMVAFLVAMVALRPDAQRDFPIVFAVVPVFLLAGAAWTTVSGRKAAEGEDAWLLRFLKETLEAEEVPDSPNDSVVP